MKVHGNIIDLSSNNHPDNAPISWKHVKRSGVIGVIVKATQMYPNGVEYVNPWFKRDLQGAISVGLPVIAYHFSSSADPKVIEKKEQPYDAAKESFFFIQTAGFGFARCLDIETSTDKTWANEFLGHLQGTNFNKLLYGSESSLPKVGVFARLWPAAYPGPITVGAMHQYTDKGQVKGIYGRVDLSVWLKTRSEFQNVFDRKPPNQFKNFVKKILKKP